MKLDPNLTRKIHVVEIEGHGVFAVRGEKPWYTFHITTADDELGNGWIITDVPLSAMLDKANPHRFNCLLKHHKLQIVNVIFKNQEIADRVCFELNKRL